MNFLAYHQKGQFCYCFNSNFLKLYHYLVVCVKFLKPYERIQQMIK